MTIWRRACGYAVAGLMSLLASVAVADSIPCPLDRSEDASLQAGLEQVLRQLKLDRAARSGQLAVALAIVDDPDHPRLAEVNGSQMFYAASLPKIAILFGAAVELERGALSMDEGLYEDLQNMIRVSCNSCATRVLDRVGRDRLTDILEDPAFRFYDPASDGGLWVGKPYASGVAYHRDPVAGLSHGANVLQATRFYCALEQGDLVSPDQNQMMLEALSDPGIHHKFVRALDHFPTDEVFRKSGTWRNFHADSALVRAGGRSYVMVALAHHDRGASWLEKLGAGLHLLATSWEEPRKANPFVSMQQTGPVPNVTWLDPSE